MNKKTRVLVFVALLAIFCSPTALVRADATGTPTVSLGYDPVTIFKAGVKYQNFNSSNAQGAYESILGKFGYPSGSAEIDFYKGTTCSGATPIGAWQVDNPVTFSYNPSTGILRTTIQTNFAYCMDSYLGDLGPLNYIRLDIANLANGTTVELKNVAIDGIPIGSFTGVSHSFRTWNVFGLILTDGFQLEGTIHLSKKQPGQDTNLVEITIGHYDVLGPVSSDVDISPIPVYLNGEAKISALVDDTTTFGSDIAYAEYRLDDYLWTEMTASDGVFDQVFENVSANFTGNTIGRHSACVRGTDVLNLVGDETCQDFVVTYVFYGLEKPITNDALNETKAGQAVPIKWRLMDALGSPISAPESFAGLFSVPIACDDVAYEPLDPIEEYASGDSGLQYLGDGYWQFNWKTPKTYARSCRAMYVQFDSGTTSPIINFKFK